MKLAVTGSPTRKTVLITLDEPDMAHVKKHVMGHFATSVKVPGFRQGTAPNSLVEKHVNQQALFDEFIEHAVNEFYKRAVANQKLRPVGQPKISIKKFVPYSLLEFEVEQDVIGSIKLPDYKKIKLAKPQVKITANDVTQVIKSLQTRSAQRVEVNRAAKLGDEVTIDFSGKDTKGEPIAGAQGKDFPLLLGSKSFIPGFEENIVGMCAGDKKEFSLTFPKDYSAIALQAKKVLFSITAKKVSQLEEPKADDELAAKVGPFKTLTELKADIKKQLLSERQFQAEKDYESQLIRKISDQSLVDIPNSLVEEQIVQSEQSEKRDLTYRGQTWQEHLKQEGITEAQHRERNRPDAESRVKASLVLSEISELENIEVTAAELEERLKLLKEQYQDPAMQAELDKPEARQDIAARILTEKTIAKLKNYSSK